MQGKVERLLCQIFELKRQKKLNVDSNIVTLLINYGLFFAYHAFCYSPNSHDMRRLPDDGQLDRGDCVTNPGLIQDYKE